jgi:uncharacterized protein (TIGR02145 family)
MNKIIIYISIFGILAGCQPERLPPIAICSAFPIIGDTTVWFEFDSGESLNNQGFHSGLSCRWDYGADGIWDTDWRQESATSYCFSNPGKYKIIVEVADFNGVSDTASVMIETFGRNKNISTLQDPRDGKEYSIAKFRDYWWMRENLEYGKVIDLAQMQTDNGTVEQYYGFYPRSTDTVFGIYDWREAMNYNFSDPQGICPPGWHIPSESEWKVLLEGYPDGYATGFYGRDGLSELNLHTGVYLYDSRPDVGYLIFHGLNRIWGSDYKKVDTWDITVGLFSFGQTDGWNFSQISVGRIEMADVFNNPNLIRGMAVRCIQKDSK